MRLACAGVEINVQNVTEIPFKLDVQLLERVCVICAPEVKGKLFCIMRCKSKSVMGSSGFTTDEIGYRSYHVNDAMHLFRLLSCSLLRQKTVGLFLTVE